MTGLLAPTALQTAARAGLEGAVKATLQALEALEDGRLDRAEALARAAMERLEGAVAELSQRPDAEGAG